MNWYVLFTLSQKTNQIVSHLNKRDNIDAFIPEYEFYYRKTKEYLIRPMFPNYIFVKTNYNQLDFNIMLNKMGEEKDGVIRQLSKDDVSALRKEEIEMFELLLDANHVVRMSQAYLQDGRAKVYEGPLQAFEKQIVKVDVHNQCAYLDLIFMKRRIKVGLKIDK